MTVSAAVALHAYRAHVSQQHHRELPHLTVEAGRGELLAGDGIGLAQDCQAIGVDGTHDANG